MKVILIILIYILITLIVTKIYFKQYDYFTTKYGYWCATCPINMTSPIGSMSQTDCKCDKGYSGPDGGLCTICQAGKYKNSTGSGSCQDCEENTYQDVPGSQTCEPCDASDCVAGEYLNGCGGDYSGSCATCPPNKYQNEPGKFECSECPNNSTSSPGSRDITDCKCDAGYERNGSYCRECNSGFYKTNVDNSSCLPCDAGKSKANRGVGTCTPCQDNKYQDSTGASSCIHCPSNSISLPGSDSVDDCLCNAGYERNGSYCSACQVGFYKTNVDNSSCLPCDAGKFKANRGVGTCNPCQDNKYQDSTGASSCIYCPSNSTSSQGSDSIYDCQCNEGYSGPDGGPCTACQAGFYKNLIGDSTCLPCEAGTFKANRGEGTCQLCPDNMTSPSGSDSVDDCYECDVGYSGPDGGPCTACQAGFYKNLIGDSTCQPCEEGKYQDDPGSQTCKPCDASRCQAGKYLNGCGGGNAGVCKDNWGVTSCGWNNNGQLGVNDIESETSLIKVRIQNNMFNNIKIIKISAGDQHSLFLNSQGHVYSCGQNGEGQLGFSGRSTSTPTLIRTYYNSNEESINYDRITITEISTGWNHSLFLSSEDRVYSSGNNYLGQLGLGTSGVNSNKSTPTLITTYYNSNEEPITYTNITITKISAGEMHSLFLTSNKRVYSCGWNKFGQLGLGTSGDDNNETTPTLISGLSNVWEIACGYGHSLFLTSDGQVYSCGLNNWGQLGFHGRDSSTPILITTLSNVREIACGDKHSLFLTSDGHVYSCGWNKFGQLGFVGRTTSPTLIQTYYNDVVQVTYTDITINKISTGYNHNLFLTSDGQVYSCGQNSKGQLGLDSNEDKITTPKLIEITSDTEISEISCGGNHSLFLESYGD